MPEPIKMKLSHDEDFYDPLLGTEYSWNVKFEGEKRN